MKALKVTGIISLIVFLLASVGIISWFTWIKLAGDKVLVSDTYYVGLQTTTDGNTKHFVEVNYYKNSSGDGLGLYDVKFNYLMDENNTEKLSETSISYDLKIITTTNLPLEYSLYVTRIQIHQNRIQLP